jgi:hypothetical protein
VVPAATDEPPAVSLREGVGLFVAIVVLDLGLSARTARVDATRVIVAVVALAEHPVPLTARVGLV